MSKKFAPTPRGWQNSSGGPITDKKKVLADRLPGDWDPAYALVEPDVAQILSNGDLRELVIHESPAGGYYVLIKIKSKNKTYYLGTHRNPETPKIFLNLIRLMDLIKTKIGAVEEIRLRPSTQAKSGSKRTKSTTK